MREGSEWERKKRKKKEWEEGRRFAFWSPDPIRYWNRKEEILCCCSDQPKYERIGKSLWLLLHSSKGCCNDFHGLRRPTHSFPSQSNNRLLFPSSSRDVQMSGSWGRRWSAVPLHQPEKEGSVATIANMHMHHKRNIAPLLYTNDNNDCSISATAITPLSSVRRFVFSCLFILSSNPELERMRG